MLSPSSLLVPPCAIRAPFPPPAGRSPSRVRALQAQNPPKRKTPCDRCRTRKRRCDFGEPKCRSCARTGNDCTYLGLGKRPSEAKTLQTLKTGAGDAQSGPAPDEVPRASMLVDAPVSLGQTALQLLGVNTTVVESQRLLSVRQGQGLPVLGSAPLTTLPAVPALAGTDVENGLLGPLSEAYLSLPSSSGNLGSSPLSSVGVHGIARAPSLYAPLPAETEVVFAIVDRFFFWSDDVLPTLHRGRFNERWPPPPLLLSAIMLVSPLFDAASQDIVASVCSKARWNGSLFARIKGELPAALERWSQGTVTDPALDITATILLGVWGAFSGLGKLLQGFYHLTLHLVRLAGWTTSPTLPAPTFRRLVAERFGKRTLVAAMEPADIAILRDIWIDQAQQHRIISIMAIAEQTRKDWARGLDQRPDPNEFDVAFRPAPSGFAEWEASFHPRFDPRVLPETPLISDAIAWIDLPRNHPDRERALANMPLYLTSLRGTVPWLAGKFRWAVDSFLWSCRAAGLQSPAQLPPAASAPPPWLAEDTFRGLVAMRDHVDAALLDFRRSLPPEIREAWASSSAAGIVSAFLEPDDEADPNPRRPHFEYAFNLSTTLPRIFLLRAELYTSIGTCLSRSLNITLVPGSLETLADEFAAQDEPFTSVLEDAILCTRFHSEWLRLERRLAVSIGNGAPVLLRCAVLHIAFYRRFRAAGVSDGAMRQVVGDARAAMDVLEAYAGRHGGFMVSAHGLAKKLWHDEHPSDLDLEAAQLGVDLEPEDEGAENGGTGLARATVRADPALTALLEAYQRAA